MLFTCARSIHINTDRKQLKQVLHFRLSFEPSFPKLTSLSFSLRPSVLRHVMYTIVDRYYMNERETWSKSRDSSASNRSSEFWRFNININTDIRYYILLYYKFRYYVKQIYLEKQTLKNFIQN